MPFTAPIWTLLFAVVDAAMCLVFVAVFADQMTNKAPLFTAMPLAALVGAAFFGGMAACEAYSYVARRGT